MDMLQISFGLLRLDTMVGFRCIATLESWALKLLRGDEVGNGVCVAASIKLEGNLQSE